MIGRTISHYKIIDKLGEGGMGEVFLAEDTSLDRKVALKFLPDFMQQDPVAEKRFLREAKSAAALDHPYICKIYEVGEEDGKSFISMEYVQGETLKDKLGKGPLPLKDALEKATEIAEALGAAHKQNIVHRDLKPSNVMLTPDGHVKVMDFGLAKQLFTAGDVESQEQTITASLSKTGMTLGTLAYMSPEQLRGRKVDTWSDIFSFGIVLYEMLSGTDPFKKPEPMETASSILKEGPPPLSRHVNEVPPLLEHTVKKMLAKEADQRYQSIHEVRTNLGELSHQAADVARGEWKVVPEQKGLRWTVSLAVILIALVGWWLFLADTPSIAPGEITSIAVLPLDNLMGDPEQDYFVEGMHEALITELSKVGALRVISRTSTVRYKGSDKSLPEIARELNVDALVEGSVLRSEETVRITAQLIALEPERHVWAENYQRELRDVLALQSEVARAIADQIQIAVRPEEQRMASTGPVNPEAHDAFLQGRHFLQMRTKEAGEKAIQYFKEAIEKDPRYALAHAQLANAYWSMVEYYLPPWEAMMPARAEALEALRLDDSLAEAHTSLGYVRLFYDYNSLEAESEFKRALELNPNLAEAHLGYGLYLAVMLQEKEAIREIKQAKELDPFSPIIDDWMGLVLYMTRRYDEAIEHGLKTIDSHPNFARGHMWLGAAYAQKQQFDEAITQASRAVELDPNPVTLAFLGKAYGQSGTPSKAHEILTELDKQRDQGRYVCPYEVATVHLGLDDKEAAFEWFERSFAERSMCTPWLRADPRLDSIRSDPRFTDLVRRVGLWDRTEVAGIVSWYAYRTQGGTQRYWSKDDKELFHVEGETPIVLGVTTPPKFSSSSFVIRLFQSSGLRGSPNKLVTYQSRGNALSSPNRGRKISSLSSNSS